MNLQPLWIELLSIYDEIRKICERHQIRYWVAWGTALGAMRHGGFIPWDDDFDLYMPRPDYERFLDVADAELPSHLRTVSLRNMSSYPFMFGKVQDIRGEVSDRIKELTGHPQNEGVFIDIFPLDGIRVQTNWDKLRSMFLRTRLAGLLGSPMPTTSAKIGRVLSRLLAWVPGPHTVAGFHEYLQKKAMSVSYEEADYVAYMELSRCGYAQRETFRKEWFAESRMVKFENIEVPVPVGVEQVLQTCYGKWEQLPPVEQRVFTHTNDPVAPWRFGPVN